MIDRLTGSVTATYPRRQVLVVDVPPVSLVPADPTVAQLLKLLAEQDRLQAERDRLQAEQAELIAALTGRVAELETRLGKNSPELLPTAELGCIRQATAAVAAPPVRPQAGQGPR